ncbi:hypothetical protein FJT64_026220 [Amphibalanus amphitrite]|uniref:Uncharacterized protein n=1 Tax=Amphibalanus amphitrite TaxID=1232801 RepID=A0A6A4WD07_AMPAM|nr:hypothetical protein FJT64_026220 [Amphibalanus amphitrite]
MTVGALRDLIKAEMTSFYEEMAAMFETRTKALETEVSALKSRVADLESHVENRDQQLDALGGSDDNREERLRKVEKVAENLEAEGKLSYLIFSGSAIPAAPQQQSREGGDVRRGEDVVDTVVGVLRRHLPSVPVSRDDVATARRIGNGKILCLYAAELAERRPEPPVSLYSAAAAGVGELAAAAAGALTLLLRAAALAAGARALSATVDQLTGGHLAELVRAVLGGGGAVTADPLAAGVCLLLAALLALGLESAGWLRALVLLSTLSAAAVFAVSAAFLTESASWGGQPLLPRGLVGLVEACALYSVVMWRGPEPPLRLTRSRHHCWDGARLTAAACGLLFLVYCCLASSVALVQHYQGGAERPLWALPGLGARGLRGAELAVGCCALVALSLLLVELAAPQGVLLAALAADGLAPAALAAPAAAGALTALVSAAAAGLLSTLQLLRLAASCQLLLAAALLCRALLERYAASAGTADLVSPAAAAARRSGGRQRGTAPLCRLKAGLGLLPQRLAQAGHEVAVIETAAPAPAADRTPLLAAERGGAHPACSCGPPPGRRLLLSHDAADDDDDDDDETDLSEPESDDTDIDAVVAEFRQHSVQVGDLRQHSVQVGDLRQHSVQVGDLRQYSVQAGDLRQHSVQAGDLRQHSVQFRPSALPRLLLRQEATPASARRVAIAVAALVVCGAGLGAALVARTAAPHTAHPLTSLVTALLLVSAAAFGAVIARQPWCGSCHAELQAPGCPWLPCAALLLILIGLVTLLQHVWAPLAACLAAGLLVYAVHGARPGRPEPGVAVLQHTDLLGLRPLGAGAAAGRRPPSPLHDTEPPGQ